jgi:hypothetical protein
MHNKTAQCGYGWGWGVGVIWTRENTAETRYYYYITGLGSTSKYVQCQRLPY